MIIKNYHRPTSPAQLIAQANFGDTASQAFGQTGTPGGMPVVARHVASHPPPSVLGPGVARQRARAKAAEYHQGVGARMQALRSAAGGVGGGGVPALPF